MPRPIRIEEDSMRSATSGMPAANPTNAAIGVSNVIDAAFTMAGSLVACPRHALAVAERPEQVVEILRYVID
jgi:hypothetical protein